MAIVIKAIMNITMKMKIMMRWYYLGNTSALGKINQCVILVVIVNDVENFGNVSSVSSKWVLFWNDVGKGKNSKCILTLGF